MPQLKILQKDFAVVFVKLLLLLLLLHLFSNHITVPELILSLFLAYFALQYANNMD